MWLETAGRADNWPKKEAEANTCTPGHSKHSRLYMEYKSKLLENSRQKQLHNTAGLWLLFYVQGLM